MHSTRALRPCNAAIPLTGTVYLYILIFPY